jgi:hypothetical protein
MRVSLHGLHACRTTIRNYSAITIELDLRKGAMPGDDLLSNQPT